MKHFNRTKKDRNWNTRKNMKNIRNLLEVFFIIYLETNRPEKRIMEEFKEKWKKQQKPVTEGL